MLYSEYITPELLKDFQKKTGYKIKLEIYEAQEEMLAKLMTAETGKYDVIIASDVVIQQMIHLGLIAPLNLSLIPNRVNVISKGSFSLLSESRSMLSMALQATGNSANSTKQSEINRAVEYILQIKQDLHFAGFENSVEGKAKVLSRMNSAAIVFNGEAQTAINEDSTLQFVIPKEGSFMWVDAMLLSSKASNIAGAYAFMNYILDAEVGANLAKSLNFATPNKASLEVIDDSFKNNRVINPNKQEINRMVFLTDLGEKEKLYDEAWMIIKTR